MVELREYSNDALFKKRVAKYKSNNLGLGICVSIGIFIFLFLCIVFIPGCGFIFAFPFALLCSLFAFGCIIISVVGKYRVCMIYVVDKKVVSGEGDTYKLKLDDQKWYRVDRDSYDDFNRNQSYKVLVKNKYIIDIYDNMPY